MSSASAGGRRSAGRLSFSRAASATARWEPPERASASTRRYRISAKAGAGISGIISASSASS